MQKKECGIQKKDGGGRAGEDGGDDDEAGADDAEQLRVTLGRLRSRGPYTPPALYTARSRVHITTSTIVGLYDVSLSINSIIIIIMIALKEFSCFRVIIKACCAPSA